MEASKCLLPPYPRHVSADRNVETGMSALPGPWPFECNKDWRFHSQPLDYGEIVNSENVASASRRILVVDDEPFVCDAVKMMLAFDGYEVHTAANGAEALALYDQQPFDLVITDF